MVSFRNKFLSDRLHEETHEVQEEVNINRQVLSAEKDYGVPKWEDGDVVDEKELTRRETAYALHKYVAPSKSSNTYLISVSETLERLIERSIMSLTRF
jgi:hypothetical protein